VNEQPCSRNRFNGETQNDYRVANPAVLDLSTFSLDGTVTNVPSADLLGAFSAPQIVRQIAPDFRAPMYVMTAINIERQLPYKFTFYLVGFNYRGKHLLRLRNINAPLPGTYNPANPGRGDPAQWQHRRYLLLRVCGPL
jgi:hypothetical protein